MQGWFWVCTILNTILILIGQFGDEFQIASRQICLDPLVDPAVQFRTEVILPVARFTFWLLQSINLNYFDCKI